MNKLPKKGAYFNMRGTEEISYKRPANARNLQFNNMRRSTPFCSL
jgi:hypothetical protein